jgi:4-cresol dehydrogenase (hydroxylating) flavoprotein subunit
MSDTLVLPEGVSAEAFSSAVGELRNVVGDNWVFSDEAGRRIYRDPFSPLPDDQFMPSAAVSPASVEEIEKILKVAIDHAIPVWTISTGRNFAYGGPAPRKPGYIVLDLKRMNRILHIDEKIGYAIVEPGVSYQQLYDHLRATGSKLWIDCAAPAWGGVLGNAVDHGAGYTPYGDHFIMQCGMEVMLADGTLVRTGQLGLEGARAVNATKFSYGPYLDGIFTQSNFGVVTKMGIWLMPEPPGYKPFMITFPHEEDLSAIIEAATPLKVNMLIPNGAAAVDLIWESAVKVTKSDYYAGEGPLPPSARKRMAEDHKLGMWNFYGALYGPEPMMNNNWEVIEAAFSKIPGAQIFFERENDPAWDYRVKLMRGEPCMTEFGLMNWIGGGGHLNFSPISPPDGPRAQQQYEMIRDRCIEYGFDYIGEFLIGWREMHHILMLMFNRANEKQRAAAYELFGILVDEAAAAGFGEYRTHLAYMDQIAGTYDYNDHALWNLHHRIKDKIDPNGILSPGKMGIWPERMRG